MIIKCFRCGKDIDTPGSSNADYIIAADTMARESRQVLIALKHNQETLEKQAMRLTISDDEYDQVEIPCVEAARALGEDLAKIIVETKEKDIQKTGIICPDDYKPADIVIWGIHRNG